MSRRKQSNPKPLKLSPDVPSLKTEDGGQTEVLGDCETSADSNSANCHMEENQGETTTTPTSKGASPVSPDMNKGDNCVETQSGEEKENKEMSDSDVLQIKKEVNADSPSPTTLHSLAGQLQLPRDVLYLKRVEITMHGNTAVCWVVCCDIPLPKGSSLGPFQGEITSAEKVRVGDLILQFSGKNSPMLVNVTAQSGAWLALLRTATSNAVKNTCVHLEGDRIWCEVVSDLEKGSELIGSFLYHLENESPPTSPVPASAPLPPPTQEEDLPKPEPPPTSSSASSSSKRSPTNHAALIFGCPFCSVRFSSPRTLQGHLAYYCSKKPPDLAEKLDGDEDVDKSNMDSVEAGKESKPVIKSETVDDDDRSKGTKRHLETSSESFQRDDESPPAKTMKMGQLFKCSNCSYTADKLSSLNRHRRIHNRPADDSEENGNIPVPLSETYCKDCNIQFSSLSTFKGHKEFYCNKRKPSDRSTDTPKKDSWEESMGGESSSSQGSPNSQQDEQPRNIYLPAGSLMTHQMIHGVSSATVIPGQTAVIFAAPVMAPSEMGITMPTVIVQPVIAGPASASVSVTRDSPISALAKVPALAHQKSSSSSKLAAICAEKPLDLSKKTVESPDKDKSPEKVLHFAKDSLKFSINRSFLRDIPPLKKIEPKSPPLVSPKSVTSNSPQENSKSPLHSSRSMSSPSSSPTFPSRPKSPEHMRQRTSPFLQGLTPHFLPLAVPGIAPSTAVQAPSSVATISKCADCNIVFYKHENYMIHKEHYCSGKKSKYSSPPKSECLKSPSGSPHSSSPPQKETSAPASSDHEDKESADSKNEVSEDVYYRFFCVPCKIKFSSASTLKAHKEFYCPHGKDSGQSVVIQAGDAQEDSTSKTSSPELVDFKCDRCDSVFTTSRLLKLHLCSGESTSMPLFRCPHCDYVTQTDTRLSDHMKVHAPTRAFRCSICGYRGNTVRGMRMHGKMHIDNGEEFTDECMIEYEEPALMPIQTNGQLPHGPVDMEAELIRLKNEPYKRRRSRKSFEKSEYILSPGPLQQTQHCPVCRDTFPNLKFLNVHMRIHEITLKYQQDLLKCHQCSYNAKSKEDLAFHVKDFHTTPRSSPSPISPKKSPQLEHRPPSCGERVNIKQEPVDSYCGNSIGGINHRNSSPSNMNRRNPSPSNMNRRNPSPSNINRRNSSPSSPDKENIVKTENIQDRSYTPKSDPSPGVRASPYSRISPHSHLSPLNTPASPPIKSQPRSPEDGMANSSGSDKHSPDLLRKDIANGSGSHSIIFPTGPMFPYFLIPQTGVGSTVVPPESTSPKIERGPKYCKNCDISFTYLATFLAHKKYYCTASKTTEELSPSASA